jgi:hypothetical protein
MQTYKFNPETLQYVATKDRSALKIIGMSAVVFICLGFGTAVKVNTVFDKIPVVLASREDQCTPENVKAYLLKLHVRFDSIVYQQVMLESANLTSPVFKSQNNLLGMQVSSGRPTTGKSVGLRFASYDNWKESLVDYALWQASYTADIKTADDYYFFLDKIYCEQIPGTKYSKELRKIRF